MDRNEAYKALGDLIFKGFLTAEMDIAGKLFIFKTLNEKEFDLIRMYSGKPNRKGYVNRFNNYFLLFSLFMVEDNNILVNKERYIPELFEFFNSVPYLFSQKIISSLNGLRQTSYDVLKYLEGFTYTSQARNNWKALNGMSPTSSEFTGIPGTNLIGMTIHQENWVRINKFLDAEEEYNKDYSMAIMVASATNSKGARHSQGVHDSHIKSAEERRQKLADLGSMDNVKKIWTPEGWAVSTDTAEELVAELERQMSGQMDKHDIFMDNYFKKMRAEAEKKAAEAEARIKEYREKHNNVFIEGSSRALTVEETRELLSKKKVSTIIVPSEESVDESDKNNFLKKVSTKVIGGN
jgi:hypothetical protein